MKIRNPVPVSKTSIRLYPSKDNTMECSNQKNNLARVVWSSQLPRVRPLIPDLVGNVYTPLLQFSILQAVRYFMWGAIGPSRTKIIISQTKCPIDLKPGCKFKFVRCLEKNLSVWAMKGPCRALFYQGSS